MKKIDQTQSIQSLLDKISSLEETVLSQANQIEELKKNERMMILTEEIREQSEEICRLRKENISDTLTVLLNRKGFEQNVKGAISGKGRRDSDQPDKGISSGLYLMFDLDKFKPINDTHGHQAGDQCLTLVGDTIDEMIRESDYAARLGGDEFVVFLLGDNIEKIQERAQYIQETLNNLSVEWNGNTINIGASMGTAVYDGSQHYIDLYETADAGLYQNKLDRTKDKDSIRKVSPKNLKIQ